MLGRHRKGVGERGRVAGQGEGSAHRELTSQEGAGVLAARALLPLWLRKSRKDGGGAGQGTELLSNKINSTRGTHMCVCVCLRVCVRERERARESVHISYFLPCCDKPLTKSS